MNTTEKQNNALVAIATSTRTNLKDIGARTFTALQKKRLVRKDWNRNDASGERVVLTEAGREVFKANFC